MIPSHAFFWGRIVAALELRSNAHLAAELVGPVLIIGKAVADLRWLTVEQLFVATAAPFVGSVGAIKFHVAD